MLQQLEAILKRKRNTRLRYQRALATITPAVGRRIGAATNAVYIPSGDVVAFGRGNQIAGNFYQRWDGSQVSLAGRIVFEQPSTYYTGTVYAWYADANWNLAYNGATGNWVFTAGTQTVTVAASAWAQGDARIIILRADSKRTLDGTNYACITINDTNTFGATSAPTASAPTTGYLGSNNGASALPGVYGGFTVCRRVLYDGTYGVQVDNSADEMAAIYAAGAGADPASIVPAEDIVFQLNPLSSSGALTTTNEAWSFPHSSDLGDGHLLTTFGDSDWSAQGTPSAGPADIASAANKVYAGGYQFTSDAADEGIVQTLTTTALDALTVIALAHGDADSQPGLVLYDATNAAEVARVVGPLVAGAHDGADDAAALADASANWQLNALVGWTVANTTDGSSGTVTANTATTITATLAGGTGNDWDTGDAFTLTPPAGEWADHPTRLEWSGEAPAGCVAFEVRVVNLQASGTVYVHQALVQRNLLANGGFERAGAGGADVFAGWTENAGTGAIAVEAALMRSGAAAAKLTQGPVVGLYIQQSKAGTASRVYRMGVFGRGNGTYAPRYALYDTGSASFMVAVTSMGVAAQWQRAGIVARAPAAVGFMLCNLYPSVTDGQSAYYDDVSLLLMDTVALTVTPAAASSLINGADTCTMPSRGRLGRASGRVAFGYTPTWSAANAAKGQTQAYVFYAYADANNYIHLKRTANTLTLTFNAAGGGAQTGTYDMTGAWNASVARRVEIVYNPGGAYIILDGVRRCAITAACVFAAAFTTVYFGSDTTGASNADGTFA